MLTTSLAFTIIGCSPAGALGWSTRLALPNWSGLGLLGPDDDDHT